MLARKQQRLGLSARDTPIEADVLSGKYRTKQETRESRNFKPSGGNATVQTSDQFDNPIAGIGSKAKKMRIVSSTVRDAHHFVMKAEVRALKSPLENQLLKNPALHSSLGLRQQGTPEKLRARGAGYFDMPKPEKGRDHMHEEDYQVLKAAIRRQQV